MKKPLQENELVHFHGPKATEPHGGHGGTSYEGVDASVKMVIWSLVIIVVTLVISMAITIPIENTFRDTTPLGKLPSPLAPERVIPTGPLIEVHPWETLPQVNSREEALLHETGRDAAGNYQIPIDRAMQAVLPTLKIAPNAPQGLTTPGGAGLQFSQGLNKMPPGYQQPPAAAPEIRGEIEKHAQK
jgi:hypothetical protein